MGVVLKWKNADTDNVTYDYVYIYRSTSSTGTYTNIASQLIADNTYFDIDGTSSNWYKIRFLKTSSSTYSAYSSAFQGGATIGYCSINDVRIITHLNTTDITDSDLYELIKLATYQLNSDINCMVNREEILWIDNTRKNQVNGSNTTFYVANWKERFIADSDDDGDVDTADIDIYQVANDGTETELTLSSITPNEGKFVLSSAPSSGVRIYVTYEWAYRSEYTPDPLVRLACINLTAAYAFSKINIGKAPTASFGNVRVYRHMDSFKEYEKKYWQIVNQINNQMIDYSESEVV